MQLVLRLGIVEFLQRETRAPDWKPLVLTAASGTANAPIPETIESTGRRQRLMPAARLPVEGRAK